MKPYPFQKKAVSKAVSELGRSDRCKVIMPCGTGKTLVGSLIRKKIGPRRSLVVAPSIALIKQLIDSYADNGTAPKRMLVVCSDDSTAREARDRHDIPFATTDAEVIRKELHRRGEVIVFSTYHSTPRIAEAFEHGSVPKFDLGIFDESHRMAGGGTFTTALIDDLIPIRKRLFMTATPRIASDDIQGEKGELIASMDDESLFGKEAFYLSFNDAIEQGYLTDYQVAVFVVKESEIRNMVNDDEDIRDVAKRVALVRAMSQHDIKKALVYHRTVRKMRWFAGTGLPSTFKSFRSKGVVDGTLWSGKLDGSDSAGVRKSTLDHFASINGDSRAVLNNCRVLQEGVDCPAIDAVCLIDPRTQPVDIVQIVGRAIRRSPSKKIATIVLPVFMPEALECDVDEFVASSEFASVWDVIAAIKSHDNRVQGWVSSPRGQVGGNPESQVEFNFDMPSDVQARFFDAISSRIVSRFSTPTLLTEELIWQWMQERKKEHGKWPSVASKELCPDGGSWSSIELALRWGFRGLPRGSSIAKLRKKILGIEEFVLTEDLVWRWMQEYEKANGKWPTDRSKELCPDGGSWGSVNMALFGGHRCLPGGSSLYKLRNKMLGIKEAILAEVLTEELVWQCMQEYEKEHGKWPTPRSKEFRHGGGTWSAVNSALIRGSRGLPGGSSLPKLRNKMLGSGK